MNQKRSYIVAFWSPFPVPEQNTCLVFAPALQDYGNIQCLDLRNNYDPRTLRLLNQADLVVVTLRQNYRELCSLFCESSIRLRNPVYLIADYVAGFYLSLAQISFEFRIPSSKLGCIPYSPRLWAAVTRPERFSLPDEQRRELEHALHIILLSLGF